MAHMNQEKKAVIKAALDKVLKPRGFKFSLRVDHYSSITCTISAGPVDFAANFKAKTGEKFSNPVVEQLRHMQVNLYWLEDHYTGEALQVLQECRDALQAAGYYDRSNAQIDYFDTAYYMHLNIGAWDKPYKITPRTMRQAGAAMTEEAIKAKILEQGCSVDFLNNRVIVKAFTL
jgi:hypothetical protein